MAQPRFMLTSNTSSDATTYALASSTPTNGRVYTAWVASVIAAGTPNTPTATGTNGYNTTITAIANAVQDQIKITLFRLTAVSSVAGVITFDFGGQTNSAFAAGLEEWIEVDSPLNVQSATGVTNAGTTVTPGSPLSAFASDLNGTYVVAAATGSFIIVRGDNTQGTMMQLATSVTSGTEVTGGSFYSPADVLSPSITCSGAGSDLVMVAIEVDNSLSSGGGGGGSDTFIPTFRV